MTKNIICVDVEATCWENPTKGLRNEIIEFGVTLIDIKSQTIKESSSILVKPTTMKISEFCTSLTTITSEMVMKDGVTYKEAMKQLLSKYDSRNCVFASWGEYDRNITEDNCDWNDADYPFDKFHLNVKYLYKAKYGHTGGLDKCSALLQIPFEGTHHRGIDDSRVVAKVLHKILF